MSRTLAIIVACLSVLVLGYAWSLIYVSHQTATMRVAYQEGDVFDGLRSGSWDRNEIKPCKKVNVSSFHDSLLICGTSLWVAWGLLDQMDKEGKDRAHVEDVRASIYDDSKSFPVTLSDKEPTDNSASTHRLSDLGVFSEWNCQMADQGLLCK